MMNTMHEPNPSIVALCVTRFVTWDCKSDAPRYLQRKEQQNVAACVAASCQSREAKWAPAFFEYIHPSADSRASLDVCRRVINNSVLES